MILLTGASGFIGSMLLKSLQETYGQANVVALSSQQIEGAVSVIHNNYQFDKDIFNTLGYNKIDTIIHAGAFTPKNANDANDLKRSNSNIYNTEFLLNANLPNLQKIIYLSAIDVYGHEDTITENTIEKPVSMYGYSKLYSEKMIENWALENDKIVQILRIGHVYGPGEEIYQKLIPIAFKSILNGQDLTIWGSGNEKRSFIYIKDVVQAIMSAIQFKENLGVINIVGKNAISINQLVEKIKKITQSNVLIERKETTFVSRNLVFDNAKLMKFLLKKETSLQDGLHEEFEYLKKLNKQK